MSFLSESGILQNRYTMFKNFFSIKKQLYFLVGGFLFFCTELSAFELKQIVLPAAPSPLEQYAAETLAKYLHLVSGKKLPIRKSAVLPEKNSCCLGPELARLGLGKLPDLQEEESLGKVRNDSLFLTGAGKNSRGTLYAVYEFLERELGIRFYTPAAEKIPRKTKLDFSRVDFRFKPEFPLGRSILRLLPPLGMSKEKYQEFLSKSRINTVYESKKNDPKFGEFWQVLPLDGDSMHIYVSAAKYYKTNPEFFALVNGKRENATGRSGMLQPQVCFTNPRLRQVLLQEVKAYWKKCGAPKNAFLRIANNDHERICQCKNCAEINKAEGSHAGLYLRVINELAAEMAKEYPDIKILANAYWTTRVTPKITRPAHNVYLKFCDIEGTFSRKMDDPCDPENSWIFRDLKNWSKIGGKLYGTTYTTNFTYYLYPINDFDTFPYNLRLYHKHGAVAFQDHSSWFVRGVDFEEWRYYLSARLQRNPYFDEEKERKEFFAFYYGPAVQEMEGYYQLIRSAAKQHNFQTGCFFLFPSFYDAPFQRKANALFNRAMTACGKNKTYADRVAKERISLLYMECSSGALFSSYTVPEQIKKLEKLRSEANRLGVKKRSPGSRDTLERWTAEQIKKAKTYIMKGGKSFLVKPDLISGSGKKVTDNGKEVIKMTKYERARIIRSYTARYYTQNPNIRFNVSVRVRAELLPGADQGGQAFAAGWDPGFRNRPGAMEKIFKVKDLPQTGYADIPVAENVHARSAYSYFYIKPVFVKSSGVKALYFEGFVFTPVKKAVRSQAK